MQVYKPTANHDADAFSNILKQCSGVSAPPAPDLEFQCVKVWGSGPAADPNSPVTLTLGSGVTLNGVDAEWNADGQVPCSTTPATGGNNSAVSVQALWTDWSNLDPNGNPTGVADPINAYAINYRAVDAGPDALKKSTSSLKTILRPLCKTAVTTAIDSIDVESRGLDEGFLRFDQLQIADAASATMGYRLLHEGLPVRADKIRVAAFRVEYYYGRNERNYVHRPSGPTLIASTEQFAGRPVFVSPHCPVWSVIIWQPGVPRRHVVVSEDRNHPDIVSLDPKKDVFVQVNYDWRYLRTLGGSFGLLLD